MVGTLVEIRRGQGGIGTIHGAVVPLEGGVGVGAGAGAVEMGDGEVVRQGEADTGGLVTTGLRQVINEGHLHLGALEKTTCEVPLARAESGGETGDIPDLEAGQTIALVVGTVGTVGAGQGGEDGVGGLCLRLTRPLLTRGDGVGVLQGQDRGQGLLLAHSRDPEGHDPGVDPPDHGPDLLRLCPDGLRPHRKE